MLSQRDAAAAEHAVSYDEHVRRFDRAASRQTVAQIGLGAGTALVVAAALRYLTLSSGQEDLVDTAPSIAA